MGDVAQAEGDGHAIEMIVRERQLLGVGLDEFDVAGHAAVEQAVATDLEHRFVDVGQHHFAGRADQAGELARQVAGAAGDIQHPVTRAHAGQFDGEALPQTMHAAREQVVHQVVFGRHRMKHFGDFLRLLAFRYILKTKMRGGFAVAVLARVVHLALT
ncbi:hypothetical protein D3C85_396540 [compost metagenome]